MLYIAVSRAKKKIEFRGNKNIHPRPAFAALDNPPTLQGDTCVCVCAYGSIAVVYVRIICSFVSPRQSGRSPRAQVEISFNLFRETFVILYYIISDA